MKKLLLLATLFSPLTQAALSDKDCENYAESAGYIMKFHQAGEPMSKVLKIAKDLGDENLLKQIIIDAYSKPRYSTKAHQQREISEFRDRIHLICLKAQ